MPDTPSWNIQYDEQGRPFFFQPGATKRNYVSPVAMGEQAPEDTSGFFHTRPEWNQDTASWDSGLDWGNILSLAAGGAMAAPFAVGALGAGAAGAGAGTEAGIGAGTLGATSTAPLAGALAPGVASGTSAAGLGVGGALAGGAEVAAPILGSTATAPIAGSLASGVPSGTSAAGAGVGGSLANSAGGLSTGTILKGIGKVAPILSDAAKAGAQNNLAQGGLKIAAENAALNRDKFATTAPSTRMAGSTRASILNTLQPTKINWGGPGSGLRGEVPTYSGGVTNAIKSLDPRTKQLADQVMGDYLQQQLSGKDSKSTIDPNTIGQDSTFDKILGGAAIGSSLLGAYYR